MSASTFTGVFRSSTDAEFRAWGSTIGTRLTAGGWVQTSDTGQINWTTVLAPTLASTFQGYDVWRSNDAGGGLSEIYVRFDYGSGAAAATPAIKVTVGFASDGIGNINSISKTSTISVISNNSTSVATNSNISAGTGWFIFCFACAVNGAGFLVSVERTHNDSGTFNNEAWLMYCASNNAGFTSIVLTPTITYPSTGYQYGIAMCDIANNTVGTTVGVSLKMGQHGGLTNPSINVFGTDISTFGGAQATVSFSSYGVSHTYLNTANNHSNSLTPAFFANKNTFLIRYE